MRLFAVIAVLWLTGCVRTLESRAIQPNPIAARRTATDSVTSERLFIHTRDIHLPRWVQLRSSASFAAVSRDRLRFHVGIVQYWEEMADTDGWTVWLEDEQGRRIEPQRREVPRVDRIAIEWIHTIRLDGLVRVMTTHLEPGDVLNVYEGRADFVFVEKDLLGPQRRSLALVAERDNLRFRFEWRFREDAWGVKHYGESTNPTIVVVPGPETRVASSTWE